MGLVATRAADAAMKKPPWDVSITGCSFDASADGVWVSVSYCLDRVVGGQFYQMKGTAVWRSKMEMWDDLMVALVKELRREMGLRLRAGANG